MHRRLAILAGALAALVANSAFAADFAGNTVEWIIPFKEGGGSDKWARFYAPMLAKALPGKPSVVVRNMPGAGSTRGTNYFAARAKPDGLTILGTSGSTQFPYLLGDRRVKYEYKDWQVVLASPTGGVLYVNPALGVRSAKDLVKLKGKKLLYGSQGATSLDLIPLLAFELLGLDVEPIFGMRGRAAGRLAFERGEVNIDQQTTPAYLSQVVPLVKAGKAVPIMSWGALAKDGRLVRDPTFPDLPHFAEVYEKIHGRKPSGPAWHAWRTFFVAGFPGQKMVFLPKGTPGDIVAAYRAAFAKVVGSPGFAKKAAKRLGVYEQHTGAAAEATKHLATTIAAQDRKWVRDWLVRRFKVKLR
ncbi:MAG: tripartite tricarboxylate transporter substrate-binding protein [Alphaproteobacteria bacterium]